MKNIVIGILLLAAVVFGGLYLQQTGKAGHAEASVTNLQQEASELQSGLEAQEQRTLHLRDQLEETRADAAAKIREAARLKSSLTNLAQGGAGQTNSKPASALAEMFKNPAMREMIKTQQKTALSGVIDKNYGKFLSDLRATPEQAAALKDLILNKQLSAADLGMSMLSDDPDPAKRADLGQQVKAANDAADAKIKELLGDDNFTRLQDYEKTIPDQMAVSGLKDMLGSGPTALTGDQEQQLVQAMSTERQNFKMTTDFSDQTKFNGDFASMFTEDRMNTYFQEQGQLNQQYLTRAQSILSPDQLTSFDKYLANQQMMQKAGMQMAAKMFVPAK